MANGRGGVARRRGDLGLFVHLHALVSDGAFEVEARGGRGEDGAAAPVRPARRLLERYRGEVEAITPAAMQATSKALLVDQPLQLVVLGRADNLEKELARYGEVRVFDTDLKRVR